MIFKQFCATLLVGMGLLATSAAAEGTNPVVTLKTSMGDITLELYADKAPITVANFLKYVDNGFYKGTLFHRVVRNFMIQGGGFTTKMGLKSTLPPIRNESDNGLKNNRGTIAMGRTILPHSSAAQFFINTVANRRLDFKNPSREGIGYCVFGRVTKGMDVVAKIEAAATGIRGGMRNVPQTDIVIIDAVRESVVPEAEVELEVEPMVPDVVVDPPAAPEQ